MASVKHSEFFGYQNSLLNPRSGFWFGLERCSFIRIKWMCISGRKKHFLWLWQMPLDITSVRLRCIWEECDIFLCFSFLLFEARFLDSVACSATGIIIFLIVIDILDNTLAPNVWELPRWNVHNESGLCDWEFKNGCSHITVSAQIQALLIVKRGRRKIYIITNDQAASLFLFFLKGKSGNCGKS
jgi:hypothetical protein